MCVFNPVRESIGRSVRGRPIYAWHYGVTSAANLTLTPCLLNLCFYFQCPHICNGMRKKGTKMDSK